MKTIIFETPDKTRRILEVSAETFSMDDLKGDCFSPEANPDIDAEVLKRDEIKFERLVENEGVYGYVLEKWNPEPGSGYEDVTACWGFVGQYAEGDETFEHYIVAEFKTLIAESEASQ